MDEMVQQLEAAAISERTESEESNFENDYENSGRTGDQNVRRKELLESKRRDSKNRMDKSRVILELVYAMEENISRNPRVHWRPSVYMQGQTVNYCNLLSGSEWLLEKPHNFAEDWLVAACPRGMRMLVIAHNGTTKCFDKYGNYRFECRTALPGGNPCENVTKAKTCVLDCVYSKETKIMFVLDILAFNNHMMSYAEAAFRQYWLENSIDAIVDLKQHTKKNNLIFKVLPKIPCTTDSLNKFLSVFPYFSGNLPRVDGLLFYYSKAQYFSGETPLVGWLYPYMVPELLSEDLNIHQVYLLEKPVSYVNYLHFIEKFEARSKRKKQRKIICSLWHAEENNDAAAASTNNDADNAEAQDNAAGSVPVDIDNIVTAQTKGYDQITEIENVKTDNHEAQFRQRCENRVWWTKKATWFNVIRYNWWRR